MVRPHFRGRRHVHLAPAATLGPFCLSVPDVIHTVEMAQFEACWIVSDQLGGEQTIALHSLIFVPSTSNQVELAGGDLKDGKAWPRMGRTNGGIAI
jgi:hypothetical protein